MHDVGVPNFPEEAHLVRDRRRDRPDVFHALKRAERSRQSRVYCEKGGLDLGQGCEPLEETLGLDRLASEEIEGRPDQRDADGRGPFRHRDGPWGSSELP